MDNLYYLGNGRTPEQIAEMERLTAYSICIFCPENIDRDDTKEVLLRSSNWSLVQNDYPYNGTKYHFMLIPRDHVTMMTDLSTQAQTDFWSILNDAVESYNLTYFGIGIRNGDMRFNGGTIAHLHIHLIVGDPDVANATPVRLKLSSSPNKK